MMTRKQQIFVQKYLESGNGRLAAQAAGYKGNPQTLAQVAYENLKKPDVVEALKKPLQKEERLQDKVVEELRDLALTATMEPVRNTDKLRALELVGKVMGMFAPENQTNIQVNVAGAQYANAVRSMSETDLMAELSAIEAKA